MNRRELLKASAWAASALGVSPFSVPAEAERVEPPAMTLRTQLLTLRVGCGPTCLWQFQLHNSSAAHLIAPPVFPLNGQLRAAPVDHVRTAKQPQRFSNGVTRHFFQGDITGPSGLVLGMEFEVNDQTPIVRFRYSLQSSTAERMSRSGETRLTYYGFSLARYPEARQIVLSRFCSQAHSYQIVEEEIRPSAFSHSLAAIGPILVASNGQHTCLFAYEHGSQDPDAYLHFLPGNDRQVRLDAARANYLPGQVIDAQHPFTTVWLQAGAVAGGVDAMASAYRTFVLKHLAQNGETRKPYIFYNSWNMQERNKWWNHKPYLYSMNTARMEAEIDAAHKLGIDVFVIDTGWYDKTGDWKVSPVTFPDGLKRVRDKLQAYGMKLGLWIGPTTAAVSSQIVQQHGEWRSTWKGEVYPAEPVWETEPSYHMCMVSDYSDALADRLIALVKELNVSHLKWDWDDIPHHPCDDPTHLHGDHSHGSEERFQSYRFQLIQRMTRTAQKIQESVPDIMIEFDITEEDRQMGLSFLSVGKYFQINNGPYYFDYDVPMDKNKDNWNLFFYQGQARSWIMRSQLPVDRWLPSILFLVHYFPDDPKQWQEVSVASLILGHNGIWGDLPAISASGVEFIGMLLAKYKTVAEDITASDPTRVGLVASSPEIYEKIAPSGKGAVVLFATVAGTFSYVTANQTVPEYWSSAGVAVSIDKERKARIDATFDKPGARLVFFGAS